MPGGGWWRSSPRRWLWTLPGLGSSDKCTGLMSYYLGSQLSEKTLGTLENILPNIQGRTNLVFFKYISSTGVHCPPNWLCHHGIPPLLSSGLIQVLGKAQSGQLRGRWQCWYERTDSDRSPLGPAASGDLQSQHNTKQSPPDRQMKS